MVPNDPVSNSIGPAGQIRGISGASDKKPAAADDGVRGAAFKALLDKLQTAAKQLEQDGKTVERPEQLSGAVDRAHNSLTDALSLGDQLLEAYREALQSPESTDDSSDSPDSTGTDA